MNRRWLAVLVALAGCAPTAPQIDNAATTDNMAVTIPGPDSAIGAGSLPTPELDGVAATAGHWRIDVNPAGDAAVFRDRAGQLVFGMRCARAGRRWLFVMGAAAGGGSSMKLITASGAASYPVLPRAFAPGSMARTPIDDPFITTALAQAIGRLGVVLGSGKALVMPLDGAVRGVIENCVAPQPIQPAEHSPLESLKTK